jgi:hypothetical protein
MERGGRRWVLPRKPDEWRRWFDLGRWAAPGEIKPGREAPDMPQEVDKLPGFGGNQRHIERCDFL